MLLRVAGRGEERQGEVAHGALGRAAEAVGELLRSAGNKQIGWWRQEEWSWRAAGGRAGAAMPRLEWRQAPGAGGHRRAARVTWVVAVP